MKTVFPKYYPEFKCIADRCRHSCCVGWEIDIDPETRERYRCVPGEFGQRLNGAIQDGEVSSFRLGSDERCPMLNANGLCDLITELGEENLCQICADHPRFRSYFSDRTEVGLGLCCEEAARLVLTQTEPMSLITIDDGDDESLSDDENELLALRGELIALAQDRSRPLEERLEGLLAAVDFAIPALDWAAVYRDLERLDPAWDQCLDSLAGARRALPSGLETAMGNFAAYLLYRHLPGALEDDDVAGRVAFCVLSTRVLMTLCTAKDGRTLADCIDFARMYSAEIEYDEDNVAALLDALWEA